MVVGKELAYVLSGGDTNLDKEISEDQMFKLELDSFMKLIETKKTQDRITHTLKTGKPLINKMTTYNAREEEMMFLFDHLKDNKNYNEIEEFKEINSDL